MAHNISSHPLRYIGNQDLHKLGQVLWNWQLCGDSHGKPNCSEKTCPWSRSERLANYWQWYREMTEAYVPEFLTAQPTLRNNDDVLDIIRLIKTRPTTPRAQLQQEAFAHRTHEQDCVAVALDHSRAFNIAASVLFMVNCGTSTHCSAYSEDENSPPLPWRDSVSAINFLNETFPKADQSKLDDTSRHKFSNIKVMVKATRLKQSGLQLQPTNDLRNHLGLDYQNGVVYIFNGTAALKEMVLANQTRNENCMISRALAFEVMDTIHEVLFPSNLDSYALLSRLISHRGFDEDLLRYERASYREDEVSASFPYFGARLAELYDELQKPTPRGRFHTWLEQKSGARYMLMATMIGVFIAVILGILGLAVASFQAWISYQQWKHPVRDGMN